MPPFANERYLYGMAKPRRIFCGGPASTDRRKVLKQLIFPPTLILVIIACACGSAARGPQPTHVISIHFLSHRGFFLHQTCSGVNQCGSPTTILANTDLNQLREALWAGGSRPSQYECTQNYNNRVDCWANLEAGAGQLFVALYADPPCVTSTDVTANLVSKQRLNLQVTNHGQCSTGERAQQQSHLALLSIPSSALPKTRLMIAANRIENGAASHIGDTLVDLRT